MRVVYHSGRTTPLRHPLWDTGQALRAHLLRITPHIPHGTGNTIIPHDGSKTVHRPLRCLRHYTMDCSARPIVRGPTRSGHSGLRRQVRLPQTSDTVASHGPDPPGKASVQRCGETQPLRVDIRDLCPPHAHLSHASAILPQEPSGPNVSLELPDEHRHFTHPDHTESDQEINASAPSQVQTGVCPQPQPTFT